MLIEILRAWMPGSETLSFGDRVKSLTL